MRPTLRAIVRTISLAGLTLILLPVYFFAGSRRPKVVQAWHRAACRISGIRVSPVGTPAREESALVASNHISYLDIPALASRLDAIFVAKADVSDWPGIGYLAKLAGTIFVDREASRSASHVDAVLGQLALGKSVIIFPEATSTQGDTVRPFKSSLFQAPFNLAPGIHAAVQPVTISYVRNPDGRPLTAAERRAYAWVGDDTLVPHLWNILKREGVILEIRFHPAVDARAFGSRKALADYCHGQTARGLSNIRRGCDSVSAPLATGPRVWSDWQDIPLSRSSAKE